MMRYALTRDEAKALRAMDESREVNLYEITSMAQLAPNDVVAAARSLAERELVRFDEGDGKLLLTNEGQAVRRLGSGPSARVGERLELGRAGLCRMAT